MVASRVEGESYFHIDNECFNDELNRIIYSIVPLYENIIKRHVYFNIFFGVLISLEILGLSLFFSFLFELSIFSFGLAALFLTIFSYFILRVYYQAQKAEQFNEFIHRYTRGCKTISKYREGIPEHHIALGNAYTKLALQLVGKESQFFTPPSWIVSLSSTMENFSCWCFWDDVYRMREALLQKAIEEHILLVKCEPTSLDIHAALANAYVMLSGLYLEATNQEENQISFLQEDEGGIEVKFRENAEKAIEEFKILNDYAPNDPWVHTQLAYSYRDLKMPEEEIREYEIILKLRPDDTETMFKLGCLYFQQGRNSQGLRVYERLKLANFKKAEQLIVHYGAES
ncbi:MAG: hypothetical protein VX777_09145 [Chlamydiota bacterium]|nr:hypothetical protein [Chlamydiota bacterium]